jgi:lysozyme
MLKLVSQFLSAFVCTLLLLTVHRVSAQAFTPGIDVSRWQGDINWSSVKNAGIEFAFCKATEGVDFVDIKYTQNMVNASAAGVLIGPYHFARPDSQENNPNDARDEANDFVDAIAPYYAAPGNFLRPVLDVERLPTLGEIPIGLTQKEYLSDWVHEFVDVVVTRLGFEPIIYTGSSYAINYLDQSISQYDLWLANWGYFPPATPPAVALGIWDDWAFWQFTDSGQVPGIVGSVDFDVFQGSLSELRGFLAVPVVPEPASLVLLEAMLVALAMRRPR